MFLNKKETQQKNWKSRKRGKTLVSVCTLFALTLTPVVNTVIPAINNVVYAANESYTSEKSKIVVDIVENFSGVKNTLKFKPTGVAVNTTIDVSFSREGETTIESAYKYERVTSSWDPATVTGYKAIAKTQTEELYNRSDWAKTLQEGDKIILTFNKGESTEYTETVVVGKGFVTDTPAPVEEKDNEVDLKKAHDLVLEAQDLQRQANDKLIEIKSDSKVTKDERTQLTALNEKIKAKKVEAQEAIGKLKVQSNIDKLTQALNLVDVVEVPDVTPENPVDPPVVTDVPKGDYVRGANYSDTLKIAIVSKNKSGNYEYITDSLTFVVKGGTTEREFTSSNGHILFTSNEKNKTYNFDVKAGQGYKKIDAVVVDSRYVLSDSMIGGIKVVGDEKLWSYIDYTAKETAEALKQSTVIVLEKEAVAPVEKDTEEAVNNAKALVVKAEKAMQTAQEKVTAVEEDKKVTAEERAEVEELNKEVVKAKTAAEEAVNALKEESNKAPLVEKLGKVKEVKLPEVTPEAPKDTKEELDAVEALVKAAEDAMVTAEAKLIVINKDGKVTAEEKAEVEKANTEITKAKTAAEEAVKALKEETNKTAFNTRLSKVTTVEVPKVTNEKDPEVIIVDPIIVDEDNSGDTATTENKAGWENVDGTWYYRDSANKDAHKDTWSKIDGVWYKFDKEGKMLSNTWFKDTNGRWYWLESSGAMSQNEWVYVNGSWFWAYGNGIIAENEWIFTGGKWYYAKAGGYIVMNQEYTVKGVTYSFDENGAMK